MQIIPYDRCTPIYSIRNNYLSDFGEKWDQTNDSNGHKHLSDETVTEVWSPLCRELAAGFGSEGGGEASGREEVVEELILQRTMFHEMKALQQEEEEEEQGRNLFDKKNITLNHYNTDLPSSW